MIDFYCGILFLFAHSFSLWLPASRLWTCLGWALPISGGMTWADPILFSWGIFYCIILECKTQLRIGICKLSVLPKSCDPGENLIAPTQVWALQVLNLGLEPSKGRCCWTQLLSAIWETVLILSDITSDSALVWDSCSGFSSADFRLGQKLELRPYSVSKGHTTVVYFWTCSSTDKQPRTCGCSLLRNTTPGHRHRLQSPWICDLIRDSQ